MLARTPSHYESLNVTRDAPTEVIRAAYRSLSQKYHPDKNSGDQDAAHMMARLNAAYSVLSDSQQREQYDMQLLSNPPRDPHDDAPVPLLHQIRRTMGAWDRRFAAIVLGAVSVVVAPVSWYIWSDHQSMLRIEQGMVYPAEPVVAPEPGWPALPTAPGKTAASKSSRVAVIQVTGPSGLDAGPAETPAPAAPAAPPKAAAAAASSAKGSDFDRLTAMLKGMGLGLHKLDLPGMASNAKPAPAKAADTARPAEPAKASAAPPAPSQAATAAAAADTPRARDEARQAAPEPARSEAKPVADAGRASAAPAATAVASNPAGASQAPRNAVIADAGSCAAPPYPLNAYRNGETGTVLLSLLVGTDGRVVESKVKKSSGWPDLDKAARKALSLCKFKPAENQTEPAWASLAYVWSID